MVDDSQRELGVVLSYLVGRQLRAAEIIEALGISRSAYYAARDEGRLVTADHIVRLGNALGLNPVDLLVRFGLLSAEAVRECAQGLDAAPSGRPVLPRLEPLPHVPPI
jgi:DNA-binding Xre family transcriptional regulator